MTILLYSTCKNVEEQESNTKPFVNTRKAARITTAPKQLSYPWGVLQYILPQSIIFPFKESETGGELRQLRCSQEKRRVSWIWVSDGFQFSYHWKFNCSVLGILSILAIPPLAILLLAVTWQLNLSWDDVNYLIPRFTCLGSSPGSTSHATCPLRFMYDFRVH